MLNNNQFNASYTDINTLKEVTGKELTSNDFTDTLKTKIDALQEGGGAVVNADWNSTSGGSEILNKPKIPTLTTEITDTTNKRYQTDNQQSFNDATSSIQTQLNKTLKVILNQLPYTSVFGTTTETLLGTFVIPANTFQSACMPNFKIKINKGLLGSSSIRLKFNTVNNFASATLLTNYLMGGSVSSITLVRNPTILSFTIKIATQTGIISDESVPSPTESTISFDPTVTNYFYISAANQNTLETTFLTCFKIIN
jgi:hypothetical protein